MGVSNSTWGPGSAGDDPTWSDQRGWDGQGDWGRYPEQSAGAGAVDSSGGSSRLLWVLGGLVVVLAVALAGMVGYVVAGNGDSGSPEEQPGSAVASSDDTWTSSPEPSSAPSQAPAVPAAASGESGDPCTAERIAADLGRDVDDVVVEECFGDWALAHYNVRPGEPVGDPYYVVRRSGGEWTMYSGIPSTKCAREARADGVPEALLDQFTTPCTSGSSESSGSGGSGGGDLGLSVSMTRPACDGRGIVVLYSAVTPGAYAQEISSALAQYPGASYLRTDQACPSLRQRDENGNVIYAVYRPSGYSKSELCADVRAAGGAAYGRWLDTTSDPTQLVTC